MRVGATQLAQQRLVGTGVDRAYAGAVGAEGRCLALCGPSGAGKSTVFELLQRFYDAQQGRILLEDGPVTAAELGSLSETLVIIAGTTNGYVAEEILASLGQGEGFTRKGFRRGTTVAPGRTEDQKSGKPVTMAGFVKSLLTMANRS